VENYTVSGVMQAVYIASYCRKSATGEGGLD